MPRATELMRVFTAVTLCLVAAGACTAAPQPATPTPSRGAVTSLAPAAAQAAVEARLTELGFSLEADSTPGLIRASLDRGADPAWFICDRITIEDRQSEPNRFHWADPSDLSVIVSARVTELGGQTNVDLSTHYTGLYLDRFNNLTFGRACGATGELERAVLGAVGPG